MTDRKYPITITVYYSFNESGVVSNNRSPEWKLWNKQVVESDAEYDSYLRRFENNTYETYSFKESKPTWKELKGKNVFVRFYKWIPKWMLAAIASLITWLISNGKCILEFLK